MPTEFGEFRLRAYESEVDEMTHLALVMGEPEGKQEVLVHVHPVCLTGDVLRSIGCDCGARLKAAMERIQWQGEGVIIYAQHQRGDTGPRGEILAHCPQEEGPDTIEAKDHPVGAQILEEMKITRIRSMPGNLDEITGAQDYKSSLIG